MSTDRRFVATARSPLAWATAMLLALPSALPACSTAQEQEAADLSTGSEAVAGVQEDRAVARQPASGRMEARLPPELVGLWIGSQYPCPASDQGFDGEDILQISPDELVGYEEVLKPTKVTSISGSPGVWEIEMSIDVGPSGVFSELGPITFRLSEGDLMTDYKPHTRFKKCE